MKFIGLDLCGVNSLACLRVAEGVERLQASAFPERPSVVLLPLVRKERLIAGDDALRNERGLGLPWPPLAMAVSPSESGRILLATIWKHLTQGGAWPEPQWQPPDGLPPLNKAAPADCLSAEARATLKRVVGSDTTASLVLAIPNQLPEESQEALLTRLPSGTRLIWRSVAVAMIWAEENRDRINAGSQLAVLDAGLDGFEISVFEFRRQEASGQIFQVPVRRLTKLTAINTGSLFDNNIFTEVRANAARLERCLPEILQAVDKQAGLIICGPLAKALVSTLAKRFPELNWPAPNERVVARGSALFAYRLSKGLPTYLDILPSLELFTLTEEHEPNWLELIPADCEVSGGQDFEQFLPRRIFIEQGNTRVASWLQRGDEKEFRKLTTDLPLQAAGNAWVDLQVSARSAGGFAHVQMTPSRDELDIFGDGQSLLLNWQSMERIPRGPQEKWPIKLQYGWPACGKLYAHRKFFDEFLLAAADVQTIFAMRDIRQRLARLGVLKERARQTIPPQMAGIRGAGGDAAPVNLLVSFSGDAPCEFLESSYGQQARVTSPLPSKEREANAIAQLLWKQLKELDGNSRAASSEINALIYILGRMGGHAPDAFRKYVAKKIFPTAKSTLLFAAGRVLQSSEHGRVLFITLKDKADLSQPLNLNWLRMLVYVLYQRTDVLREVPREHIVATTSLCLNTLEQQVEQGKVKVLFMNSLRALALLLRARRHGQSRDFICATSHAQEELLLARRLKRALSKTEHLRLSNAARTLVERTVEWLDFTAATDEMPPIAPPDEEETEDDND